MSISSSSASQICNSPTNTSKSKMLYSFSRTERFKTNKENQCDKFYEINKQYYDKGTNIGYGNKFDFTKRYTHCNGSRECSPSPSAYQLQTIFDVARKKNKGYGFGIGRQEIQSVNENKNPGPGSYQITSNPTNIYSSLRGKPKIEDVKEVMPGPDELDTNLSKTGVNFCSKYRNQSSGRFGQEIKHKHCNSNVPGPGHYDFSKMSLSPDGKYFSSRLQSAKNNKFGTSSRTVMEPRGQTPGPGNYQLPSEFGHYSSPNAFKQCQNTIDEHRTI